MPFGDIVLHNFKVFVGCGSSRVCWGHVKKGGASSLSWCSLFPSSVCLGHTTFHASCGSLQLAQHGFSASQLTAMWPSCSHLPHLSFFLQWLDRCLSRT